MDGKQTNKYCCWNAGRRPNMNLRVNLNLPLSQLMYWSLIHPYLNHGKLHQPEICSPHFEFPLYLYSLCSDSMVQFWLCEWQVKQLIVSFDFTLFLLHWWYDSWLGSHIRSGFCLRTANQVFGVLSSVLITDLLPVSLGVFEAAPHHCKAKGPIWTVHCRWLMESGPCLGGHLHNYTLYSSCTHS